MCGRFTLRTPAHTLAKAFGVPELPNLRPRYNVAPTQDVPAVRRAGDGAARELAMRRWGLIPSWAREPGIGSRMINARAETVAEKPSFRSAFRRRRCLVPADGFYEWQKTPGGAKQPFHIHLEDDAPFAIAGLWERWQPPDGEAIESCTLITTGANELLRPIHDRMPVILAPADYDAWLDPEPAPAEELKALLRPYPADEMTATAVGRQVNDARNDEPGCVEPLR